MSVVTRSDSVDKPGGVSRRSAMRAGAVGGALIWTVPLLQVIDMTAASADHGSPHPTGPGLPSHGFALINCGDGVFAVKIDSSNPSVLASLGSGNDIPFLETKGLTLGNGTDLDTYRQATEADLQHIASFGTTTFNTQPAMFITIGAGCTFQLGYTYTFDGSFSGGGATCGDGDKFTTALRDNTTVFFAVQCNEPSTGEL